ncbi:MAG TPA: ester cyclase [Candidatus Bathyarchaeia archaeon]|nr:ester cyclase [Candidatus Bathyarchaeia archaeon]
MSVEELKALERRYYEALNKRNLAALSEFFASDFVEHTSLGSEIRGFEEYKKYINDMVKAFPDFHFTLRDFITEGDKVAIRWTLTGTHKGEFRGIPPTNKKVTMWGIDIDRVTDGKFVEGWCRFDTLGMMEQLGIIPASKTTGSHA